MAKEFVKALIDGDRANVERLLGNSKKNIDFIYSDIAKLDKAIEYYKNITSWNQIYHSIGYATVTIHIKTLTEEFDGGFEMAIANRFIIVSL